MGGRAGVAFHRFTEPWTFQSCSRLSSRAVGRSHAKGQATQRDVRGLWLPTGPWPRRASGSGPSDLVAGTRRRPDHRRRTHAARRAREHVGRAADGHHALVPGACQCRQRLSVQRALQHSLSKATQAPLWMWHGAYSSADHIQRRAPNSPTRRPQLTLNDACFVSPRPAALPCISRGRQGVHGGQNSPRASPLAATGRGARGASSSAVQRHGVPHAPRALLQGRVRAPAAHGAGAPSRGEATGHGQEERPGGAVAVCCRWRCCRWWWRSSCCW